MIAFGDLRKAICESKQKSGVWGCRGRRAAADIKSELGFPLPDRIRDFVVEFGNVNLAPFQLVVAGNQDGTFNCVTETRMLRDWHPATPDSYVQIMDYARVVYCAAAYGDKAGRVISWDHHYLPSEQTILDEFSTFDDFILWLIAEAKEIELTPENWTTS